MKTNSYYPFDLDCEAWDALFYETALRYGAVIDVQGTFNNLVAYLQVNENYWVKIHSNGMMPLNDGEGTYSGNGVQSAVRYGTNPLYAKHKGNSKNYRSIEKGFVDVAKVIAKGKGWIFKQMESGKLECW